MRRFIISTLTSSRRSAYRSGGYAFSGTGGVSDTQAAWLINMQINHRRCSFMSTQTNTISYNESKIKDEERNAIRIEVISKEHIKPSTPTPKNLRHYKVSMFDQVELPIYHPFMFFYRSNNNNDNKNIEEVILDRSNHLKRSLSETLTRMYPFAGKVGSELHIDCNDDGAYYIETRIDDCLDNVLKTPDFKFLKRLLPVVDSFPNLSSSGSYVSVVQVNFFNCGGVSITLQNNHKLADARSTIIFLNTWAAIARRDPNQIHPDFLTSSMFPQNPNPPFSPYIPLWFLTICPAYIKHGEFETKRFGFDALALQELKAKASKHQPVSRVVALLALFSKCISMETQSKPSVLHIPVDIRQQLSPPLSESSIGNIKSGACVRFEPGASEMALMASELKDAIAASKGGSIEELKGEKGYVKFAENVRKSMGSLSDYKSEVYLTSSLCNSGTREADFGWGKPVWSCTGNHLNDDVPLFTNRIILMDSCSGDGIEAWVTLEKQVMDGVKCNPELLSFASVDPSPI